MAGKEWGSDISDLIEPCTTPSAIHGMVTKLSPLKESTRHCKKYFDGTFSDDSDTKRFVSFNTKLFQSMKEAKDSGASIALNKCSVKGRL